MPVVGVGRDLLFKALGQEYSEYLPNKNFERLSQAAPLNCFASPTTKSASTSEPLTEPVLQRRRSSKIFVLNMA